MRGIIAAVMTALLLTTVTGVQQSPGISADMEWCVNDPVLHINGRVVHLSVAVPWAERTRVIETQLVITVPRGVDVAVNGVNAANGTGALNIKPTIVRAGAWDGSLPIPVLASAIVYATPSGGTRQTPWDLARMYESAIVYATPSGDTSAAMPTRLKVWKPGGEPLAEREGVSPPGVVIGFSVP